LKFQQHCCENLKYDILAHGHVLYTVNTNLSIQSWGLHSYITDWSVNM